ncbi:MAG: DUF4097 domain-containing protein [Gemmatimonadota bacterium]|nr:DUF4097 domain-containing protein [Gemmatimonadota bacterium]
MSTNSRIIWSLAALGVVVAAPLSAQRNRGRDDTRTRIDTTFAFGARGTVDLSAVSGTITVRGGSRDEVKVSATSDHGVLRLESSGSRLTLSTRSDHGNGGDTRYEVTVPTGTRVLARTTSGDITIRGVKGEVEIHSTNGNMKIDDAERVTFDAISGDVEATRVTGILTGTTVSGDLKLDGGVGEVDVETVSGEIALTRARAKSVRLKSVSGDIDYEGTIDAGGRYVFGSHSGRIRLALPDNANVTLSIDTFNGDVQSDFPMVLNPGERRGRHMEFTIGSGGARLTAETFSGDVEIKKIGRRER